MKIIGVIPARYKSSRFPGKPLADICGKPMIWWVYQQAQKVKEFSEILIAADDERVEKVCRQMHMNVVMTSDKHETPTNRIFEISQKIDADYYIALMGDEPLLNANSIYLLLQFANGVTEVAALTNILASPSEVIDFSNQKVVTNSERDILFISRSPIPYPKGTLDIKYEKITGIQMFSKDALEFYAKTPKSLLEKAEENDLMRFVEHGINVKAEISPYKTISVDTLKDLEAVIEIVKSGGIIDEK